MSFEPRLLTIAGSDSGGAAGLQADLKTFTALGAYGMSVTTLLTAQNSLGVHAVQALPVAFIEAQLEAVLSDLGVDSLKTGLLGRVDIIELVAAKLAALDCPKVIDPVIVNGQGERIVEAGVLEAYQQLFKQATLITPNIREAQHFAGLTINHPEDMATAAQVMLASGAKAVLVKGGYLPERAGLDCLCVAGKEPLWLEADTTTTPNTHGTGCTLAAACATYLATEPLTPEQLVTNTKADTKTNTKAGTKTGTEVGTKTDDDHNDNDAATHIEQAVRRAKAFVTGAIVAGAKRRIGQGRGPVKHTWQHQPHRY